MPPPRNAGPAPDHPRMLLRNDRVVETDPNQVSLTDRYLVDALRFILGDARTGIAGANCRPAGRVENPRTLLPVPEDDIWVRAVYD